LVIHGVLIALIAWWLTERSCPTSAPATPVPLTLAMFQAPAPVERPAPAEPTPAEEASPSQGASEQPPIERSEPKPIPVKPRPAKAAPPKPAAPAVEPARAQPVESAVASEAPVAAPSPAPVPVVQPPAAQPVTPAPDPALEDGYRARIRQAVDEHKHYPRMARRLGLEGRVVVAFTVGADGRLAGVRLVESSGSELLDEAALEAVRQAAPFPPFPAGIERRQWDFTLPLSFALER
jgi:protein TonB